MVELNRERPKFVLTVGKGEYNLTKSVRDLRGIDIEELKKAVAESQVEHRLKSIYKMKLYPYAEANDLAEWTKDVIQDTYKPIYLDKQSVCSDCAEGPCNVEEGKGRCGLEFESYQAKLSLKTVVRGCISQMVASREMVNYALKAFPKDAPISFGPEMDTTDATWVGTMCGFYPETLEQMDRALSYAERELNKLFVASIQGNGSVTDFESLAMFAGLMLFVAQEVAEFIKVGLFGFHSAMTKKLDEMPWYPPGFWSGIGLLDPEKPTITFIGDNFIPAWLVVDELKKKELSDKIQVIGIASMGDDIARFYDKVCVIGTIYRAKKLLRLGLTDVIVANEACIPFDFSGEAERVGSRLIWTGSREQPGLKDRTEDPTEGIVEDLLMAPQGVWVRDLEKAAEIAIKVAQGVELRRNHVLSEEEVKKEAAKCREDCDLCLYACPNNLAVSKGMRAIKEQGLKALFEVDKSCTLCGKCQKECPEKIPIEDLMVAAYGARTAEDKFLFRGGRGAATRSEIASYGFSFFPGNSPGMYGLIGCANSNPEDIAWIANKLGWANGIVSIGGCVAADVAHLLDVETGHFMFRKYPFWHQPRAVANLGGCTACQYMPWIVYKYSRTGTGITWAANFAETMDEMYFILNMPMVIWGGSTERMYALAAAYAACGCSVIVGPVNAQRWQRLLSADKWDWENWWFYDSLSHKTRATEPSPKQLIIPVETKEEVITHLMCDQMKVMQPFIMRMIPVEFYCNWHREFFGELPDDWTKYTRTFTDLPGVLRFELIEYLRDLYGWVVYGLWVAEIPHPDGNRYDQKEFLEHYARACDSYTKLPRLWIKPRKKVKKE